MERSQRIGLLVVAAVIAAVAVVVLVISGGDDSSDSTSGTKQVARTIEIKNGKPVGGVAEIEVNKGDRIHFTVKSDADHEIHMHGYDIEKDVKAGGKVVYDVPATIDGVFEVEVEDTKQQLADLRVNP